MTAQPDHDVLCIPGTHGASFLSRKMKMNATMTRITFPHTWGNFFFGLGFFLLPLSVYLIPYFKEPTLDIWIFLGLATLMILFLDFLFLIMIFTDWNPVFDLERGVFYQKIGCKTRNEIELRDVEGIQIIFYNQVVPNAKHGYRPRLALPTYAAAQVNLLCAEKQRINILDSARPEELLSMAESLAHAIHKPLVRFPN